jgi:hypothetical protein
MRPVSAPRHCGAYPRTANAPSPRRGADGTLECLFRDYAGPCRDVRPVGAVIPVAVNPVRPYPPLPHHAGHYGDIPMLLECMGTRRRNDCHRAAYGPPVDGTLKSVCGDGRTTNHYTATLVTAPVRAQDAPRRLGWSRIRQDGRQLHDTARHASTRRKIVRHTCKLLPPWPIKGGAVPQLQGRRDDGQQSPTRSLPSPRYWHLPQSIPLGLEGQASSPSTFVAPLYKHHGATQYSAPSTPLLDVRPRPETG